MSVSRILDRLSGMVSAAVLTGFVAHAQLTITTSSLPRATAGVPYSATLGAMGGTLPYTWTMGGSLPQGLMFNPGSPSATINGTPAEPPGGVILDPELIRFQVSDAAGMVASAMLTVIVQPPVIITTAVLPSASIGNSYFACLSASGGGLDNGEFWAIIGGSLPTGLTLGTNSTCPGPGASPSAAISGTPTQTGNFNVVVQVSDPQSNSAQMSYALAVGGAAPAAALSTSPAALSAAYTIGGSAPGAQAPAISSSGAPLSYNSSVSYAAGSNGSWVSLTNPSGITPGTIGVTLMPSGLPAGTYNASVSIASSASNGPLSVPVTLTVTPGISLILSPPTVTFTYVIGAATPPQQVVQFSASSGSLTYGFTAPSGASWLSAVPSAGSNSSSLALSVNPAGLAPGTYGANIQVSASGAVNSPQPLGVTLIVEAAKPEVTSILNAASLQAGAIAPGSIVTIKGAALGPATGVSMQPDANGDYGTALGGTQVLFNGVAAPMLYAQAGQINAIVPFESSGASSDAIQVVYNNTPSGTVNVPIQAAAPALFTASMSGTGQGAILNQDSTLNSSAHPAKPGTVVQIFGTGGGNYQTTMGDGTTAHLTNLMLPVTAQIGGVNAQVSYAGAAPGLVAGSIQINAAVPAGTPQGNAPVVVFVNGIPSQSPVTVAVGP